MLRTVVRWLGGAVLAFVGLSLLAVMVVRVVPPLLTPLMVIRGVDSLLAGEPVGVAKDWVPLREIAPALPRAVIAAEDARFFTHHGVDWRAVEEAREYNRRNAGRRQRGASTITMQCARNVFLWQGRTWVRKGLELWFTALLELCWPKRRILEVYLNVAEWGRGVYGAEAAAQHWFGVPAARLSAQQAALLAAMLPSPLRWDPARPTRYLAARARRIAGWARDVDLRQLE
ncbi:MAG: monofunctional biosynthetic peptidoglycan transglycosylase [bacterium]|nr:monofunctional biosynthetic peptidoglycan transglycosylase [bacterium]